MNYLDFQYNIPVFVRSRHENIVWKNKTYELNDYLPWQELDIPYETVRNWWLIGLVYHNTELEQQVQVGDRLVEFSPEGVNTLVDEINTIVKNKATSTQEFNKKKCKKSKLYDKQLGLIRSFLRNNVWILDDFYTIRDKLLDE